MFPPLWQPEEMISLIVRVERGQVAEVTHVARTRLYTHLEHTGATPFTVQLLGEGGRVLAEGPLLRLDAGACGCGCAPGEGGKPDHYLAQALVPDVAPGEALVISDGEAVVWERRAPAEPARVEGMEAFVDSDGALQVFWNATGEAVEYWLRWSTDGETWHALATGLTGREARVAAEQLPPGSVGNVLLQLVAHDGFFSSASRPVEVSLPERGPEVAILHPRDGHTYAADQTLRLWGSVTGLEDRSPLAERAVWLLDGNEVARGLDAWTTLEPGQHKVTLLVEGEGGRGESSVTITVARLAGDE